MQNGQKLFTAKGNNLENIVKAIHKWQVDAGLADRPYDDFLESSFQIEEALEGFDSVLGNTSAKDYSRDLLSEATDILSDVDRFDKAIDAIVFAIGSMAKLRLTPQQIQRGILAVNRANMQKLKMPVDEHGKLIKPKDFVGPEVELQKILDERE